MMALDQRVVIVGASLAGVRGAEALRRAGFRGRITLVGAERHFPPYDRPPLSKQILAGSWQPEAGRLRVDDSMDLDLLLGRPAEQVDMKERVVRLDGITLPFDGLMVATGATPRCLPAGPRVPGRGVHTLRTVDDCLRLREELRDATRVAVVGAGFIGCEVAATCRTLGLDVTLIDVLPQPMLRVVGPEIARVLAEFHRSRGVRLALGRTVLDLPGDGRVEGVLLDGDDLIDADVVVVAIGVRPETRWLDGSGLMLRDGVVCDEHCFALGADTAVAVGDVARWYHQLLGMSLRVEHWTNAVSQAQAAGRNLAARLAGRAAPEPYAAVPYFWSDQHDWKLQFAGVTGDEVSVEEGAAESGTFVAAYRSAGRLVGALCVNRPARLAAYRRRILAEWSGCAVG